MFSASILIFIIGTIVTLIVIAHSIPLSWSQNLGLEKLLQKIGTKTVKIVNVQPSEAIPFPSGTINRLTLHTSLMDGATWHVPEAPRDRNLSITFQVEAETITEGTAIVTVRLLDNKNITICTVTASASPSSNSAKHFSGFCDTYSYFVPANTELTLRAEAKTENAKLRRVELSEVNAKPR